MVSGGACSAGLWDGVLWAAGGAGDGAAAALNGMANDPIANHPKAIDPIANNRPMANGRPMAKERR